MNWEDELRKLSAPDPPGELLARILASRAAGARVLLPGVAHQRFTWRELVVAAAAAVVITLAVAPRRRRVRFRSSRHGTLTNIGSSPRGDRRAVAPLPTYRACHAGPRYGRNVDIRVLDYH